jgi:Fe-S oxidoreductase
MLHHWLNGRLVPDEVMAERVFACTSCGLCDVACGYPQSKAIQEMKATLIEQGVLPPETYTKISDKTRLTGNPYGETTQKGTSYLQSIPESRKNDVNYTLFLGCTQIYREDEEIDSLLKVLRAAAVSFRVIQENVCCGSPAYRTGDVAGAKIQAERVMELIKKTQTDEVIVSCAGCYSMFTNVYPELLAGELGLRFVHSMDLIDELLQIQQLSLNAIPLRVTYHDACHLGRHSDIYEQPRRILGAIPDLELVEMEWNRKFSKCCGAGGGFKSGMSEESVAIAAERVQEAEATGAQILATACPFCLRNLRDGAAAIGSKIEVRTVESLIAQAVTKN